MVVGVEESWGPPVGLGSSSVTQRLPWFLLTCQARSYQTALSLTPFSLRPEHRFSEIHASEPLISFETVLSQTARP